MSNQLQAYVDTQVAEISPYLIKSNALLSEAKTLKVSDVKSAKEAVNTRKQITAHKKLVADTRKEITRQFDEVKKQFIAAERDVLAPAEEAQEIIQSKLLEFERIEAEKRAAEEKRVAEVIAYLGTESFTHIEDEAKVEDVLQDLEDKYAELPEDDQTHPEIKLAYSNRKAAILEHLDELMLGVDTDDAEVATNKADLEDAALAAELKAKAEEASKPKMRIKTVTRFEITDPQLVPRELCEPSDKLIRQLLKQGVPEVEIPGVRVWQERSF